jgi:hypothetical protein
MCANLSRAGYDLPESHKHRLIECQRAALSAIRGASPAMVRAAWDWRAANAALAEPAREWRLESYAVTVGAPVDPAVLLAEASAKGWP